MGSGIQFTPAFNSSAGANVTYQSLQTPTGGNVFIPILPAQSTILPVFIPGGTRQAAIKWFLVVDSTGGNGGLQLAVNTSNVAVAPFICSYKLLRDVPTTISLAFIAPGGAFITMFPVGSSTMYLEIDCTTENVPAAGLTLSLQITEAVFDPNPGSFSKGSYSRLTILK
jgi:hypothetical protein